MIGQIIDNRYKINKIIGTGGMAIVYDGYDTVLSRKVAIKVLKDNIEEGESYLNHLKMEASASASLIDENIVSIYDVATTEVNGRHIEYIVMEKIDGKTLKELIREEAPFTNDRIVNFAIQISKALQTAHLEGVVHRDIKPANILIGRDDKVKVVDFGIARVATDATITYTSSILGTVHYISPEQAKGQIIDSRSDLYSLGVVLYEMATGKVPFDGDSPVSIAVKHIQEEPIAINEINEEISEDLAKIVNKLLEKNPENRYKTASNLLVDLNKLKNGVNLSQEAFSSKVNDSTRKQKLDIEQERKQANYKSKNLDNKEFIAEIHADENKKKRNIVPLVILGSILAFLLVFFVSRAYINSNRSDNLVTVPSLLDLSESDAMDRLNELGLEARIKERVYDENIAEGHVISQSIQALREVEKGSLVDLTISRGQEMKRVPDLVGMHMDDLEDVLRSNGFEIGETIELRYEDVEEGYIYKQYPEAYSDAPMGSSIDIYVSLGPEETETTVELAEVPNISWPMQYTEEQAIEIIQGSNLIVGEILTEYSEIVPEGYIIRQNIAAGQSLNEGSHVGFTVSLGQETEEETFAETETEVETELETQETIEEQEFLFNITIPDTDKDSVNVQIINDQTGETVYNRDVAISELDSNNNIQISILDRADSTYTVKYDGKDAEVNYE